MKNLFTIFVLMLCCIYGFAQTEKGTFQVGVTGFALTKNSNNLPNGYSLRGNIGYFPINKLSVGITPYYGKIRTISSSGANVYARYYFINRRTSVFLEGSTGFGTLRFDGASEFNGAMHSMTIGPGMHYRILDNLAVEFSAQYGRLSGISDQNENNTSKTFMPSLGVQYFFRKK